MAEFITIADLPTFQPQDILAGLADFENTPPDWDDSATQEVLQQGVDAANQRVTNALRGRVDFTDSELLASAKSIAGTFAVFWLYGRRNMYNANPFLGFYKDAKQDLVNMQEGASRPDSSGKPNMPAVNNNASVKPAFMRDADGNQSNALRNF